MARIKWQPTYRAPLVGAFRALAKLTRQSDARGLSAAEMMSTVMAGENVRAGRVYWLAAESLDLAR